MTFAGCILLIIPFDAWNTRYKGGIGSALEIIWQVLFGVVGLLVCLVIPWALIYYESYDEDKAGTPKGFLRQCLCGLIGSLITFGLCALIIGVTYIWLGIARIDVKEYTGYYVADDRISAYSLLPDKPSQYGTTFDVRMSFLVYLIALLSLAGWFCLLICGGCGLTAVPLELILWFVYRPKKISKSEFIEQQKKYAARAHKLIEIGKRLDDLRKQPGNRAKPKSIRSYRAFKDAVYQLDDDFKKVKTAFERGGGWIVLYIFSLGLGIVLAIITVLWIVHLIVYTLPTVPLWGGLNQFYIWFDTAFPLFGMLLYSIFAFYLLFSILAGNILIAGRIPICSVYPIRWKDTFTSSFLFNTGLLLLGSLTVVQFCASTFEAYVQNSVIDSMMNTYVKHILGLGYVFQYLDKIFFGFIFLGFFLAICNIAIKQRKSEKEIEAILNS